MNDTNPTSRRVPIQVPLDDEERSKLDRLATTLGLSRAATLRRLLREAKEDPVMGLAPVIEAPSRPALELFGVDRDRLSPTLDTFLGCGSRRLYVSRTQAGALWEETSRRIRESPPGGPVIFVIEAIGSLLRRVAHIEEERHYHPNHEDELAREVWLLIRDAVLQALTEIRQRDEPDYAPPTSTRALIAELELLF